MNIIIIGDKEEVIPNKYKHIEKHIKEFYIGLYLSGIFNTFTYDKRNLYIIFNKDFDYPTKNCILSFIKNNYRHCIYNNIGELL